MEDKERTLYCGNLSDKVTEDLLYELFLQAGPLENVTIPKDKDGRQRNFGFVAFKHAVSVQYAVALMNNISLYGKQLRLDARSNSLEENPYVRKLEDYMRNSQRRYQQHNQGFYNYNNVPNYQHNNNRYPQNSHQHQMMTMFTNTRNETAVSSSVVYPTYIQPTYVPMMPPQMLLPPINNFTHFQPARPGSSYKNSPRSNYRN